MRRAAEESNPDREVEVVEPVRRGGARPELAPAGESDESPELVPFGIGVGLRGLGFGGRPVLAIRPLPAGRDSVEASDEEADYGGGYLNPYFIDPMSNFMAQMAGGYCARAEGTVAEGSRFADTLSPSVAQR